MDDDSSLTTHSFCVRLPGKKSKADPRVFPHTWPRPPQKNWNLAELRASAAKAHHTNPPLPTPKQHAFAEWARDLTPPLICKWTQNELQVPLDSTPADLVFGALKLKQRHIFCVCLQVYFKHCFSGSFSLRFRPTAGDTIICPCSDTPFESGMAPHPSRDSITPIFDGADLHADPPPDPGPEEGFLTPPKSGPVYWPSCASSTPADGSESWHADPSPGFRRLMEEFLHPSSGREASVHPDPLRKIHSPEHVLMECPLTEPYRHLIRDLILGTVNICSLFYTIKGAESLVTFLLCSNSLLRPLPP